MKVATARRYPSLTAGVTAWLSNKLPSPPSEGGSGAAASGVESHMPPVRPEAATLFAQRWHVDLPYKEVTAAEARRRNRTSRPGRAIGTIALGLNVAPCRYDVEGKAVSCSSATNLEHREAPTTTFVHRKDDTHVITQDK